MGWQLYSIKLFQNVVYKHSYFSEKVPMKEKCTPYLLSFLKGTVGTPETHLITVLDINDYHGRMHYFFLDSSYSLIIT